MDAAFGPTPMEFATALPLSWEGGLKKADGIHHGSAVIGIRSKDLRVLIPTADFGWSATRSWLNTIVEQAPLSGEAAALFDQEAEAAVSMSEDIELNLFWVADAAGTHVAVDFYGNEIRISQADVPTSFWTMALGVVATQSPSEVEDLTIPFSTLLHKQVEKHLKKGRLYACLLPTPLGESPPSGGDTLKVSLPGDTFEPRGGLKSALLAESRHHIELGLTPQQLRTIARSERTSQVRKALWS